MCVNPYEYHQATATPLSQERLDEPPPADTADLAEAAGRRPSVGRTRPSGEGTS